MKGYLFGDHEVEIDPRSHEMGGSWQGPLRDGKPCAWDPDSLRSFYERMYKLGRGTVVVDVGANTGSFCLLPTIGHGCFVVLAFEPQPEVNAVLRTNIKLNNLGGIVYTIGCALSDSNGSRVLLKDSRQGHSGTATFHEDSIWLGSVVKDRVPALVFDDMYKLHSLDLVKVDTEGHDANVLRGMERHLLYFQPDIMFEEWPGGEARKYLELVGYKSFFRIGRDNWWASW